MFYYFVRGLFAYFFRFFYSLNFKGLENLPLQGPYIICANHTSWFDPPLVGCLPLKKQKDLSIFIKVYELMSVINYYSAMDEPNISPNNFRESETWQMDLLHSVKENWDDLEKLEIFEKAVWNFSYSNKPYQENNHVLTE